ncbi:MAG: transglycosylase SLT domain-containing protein, partial [Sulfobacillus sp.]
MGILNLSLTIGPSHRSGTHKPVLLSSAAALSTEVARWRSIINQAAKVTGVPAPWIAAEIVVESRGDAQAGTLAGAYGLMQLEPGTLGLSNAERANPTDNI